MRAFPLLALAACHAPAAPVEPVVLETTLERGPFEAGAPYGIEATLVNRTRARLVQVGGGPPSVLLTRQPDEAPRRADAPSDTTRPVGRYWEQAYHLANAGDVCEREPCRTTTLVLHLLTLEPRGRLALPVIRFRWPEDPGAYTVRVCSNYGADSREPRPVCAPAVRVEVR